MFLRSCRPGLPAAGLVARRPDGRPAAQVTWRAHLVRQRTRIKNQVHDLAQQGPAARERVSRRCRSVRSGSPSSIKEKGAGGVVRYIGMDVDRTYGTSCPGCPMQVERQQFYSRDCRLGHIGAGLGGAQPPAIPVKNLGPGMAPMMSASGLMIFGALRCWYELSAGITNGQLRRPGEHRPRSSLGDVALVAAPDGRRREGGMATGTFVL